MSVKSTNSVSVSTDLPIDISMDLDGGLESTQSFRPSLDRWVDAMKTFGELSVSRKLFAKTRLRLGTNIASITDRGTTSETDASQFGLDASTSSVLGKFSLKSAFTFVSLNSEASTLPYELSQGWYIGKNFRWDASINYRAGSKTELSLIYRGEKKADTDTKHTAEFRVRLLF